MKNIVTRSAVVNRNRSSEEALNVTGCRLDLNQEGVRTIPQCTGDINAIFVNLDFFVSPDKLDEELAKLGYELIIDPVGLAAINETDPDFMYDHPNCTQWKDEDGRYWGAMFDILRGMRNVDLRRARYGWVDHSWFPCRRKSV